MDQCFNRLQSRRRMLQKLGVLAGAGLALDAGIFTINKVRASMPRDAINSANPVNHVLVACQENRTFDEYFGYYPKAGKFGVPTNYFQPDGKGGTVKPYHFPRPTSSNIPHSWQAIHSEWNNGAMNGFATTDGLNALGYYD